MQLAVTYLTNYYKRQHIQKQSVEGGFYERFWEESQREKIYGSKC